MCRGPDERTSARDGDGLGGEKQRFSKPTQPTAAEAKFTKFIESVHFFVNLAEKSLSPQRLAVKIPVIRPGPAVGDPVRIDSSPRDTPRQCRT
jgi:hypothetical protein